MLSVSIVSPRIAPLETNAKQRTAKSQEMCAASQTGHESQPTFAANKDR